jgi:hypothetical protein
MGGTGATGMTGLTGATGMTGEIGPTGPTVNNVNAASGAAAPVPNGSPLPVTNRVSNGTAITNNNGIFTWLPIRRIM